MTFSRVRHSAKKATAYRRGHMNQGPKRVHVDIDVRRVLPEYSASKHPYFAEACFRDPRGGHYRHKKFDRCADGRGKTPTAAIKSAMRRLSTIVR